MERNLDNIIYNIINLVEELERENRAILDISVYPKLSEIVETQRKSNTSPVYYIPDTIPLLLKKAKENEQYYFFLSKLFAKWTQRLVNLRLLNRIFIEREYGNLKFELITKEMIDKETYSFCYHKIVDRDLLIELSPEFNLIGDIIGKMLGFSKRNKVPILMLNQRLVRYIKKEIPIFDTANMLVDRKERFFSKFIPLKRTRGIRWLLGITVGSVFSPIGFILTVIDP